MPIGGQNLIVVLQFEDFADYSTQKTKDLNVVFRYAKPSKECIPITPHLKLANKGKYI